MKTFLMVLFLTAPAAAFQEGELIPHNHSAPSQGGAINSLNMAGPLSVRTTGYIGPVVISSDGISGVAGMTVSSFTVTSSVTLPAMRSEEHTSELQSQSNLV